VDSLASATSLVWLTNWRVVFSLSAMAAMEKPLLISDQTVFCFWLRGEVKVQVGDISGQVNTQVFTHV
jgi:hypothetical protein